MKLSDIQGNVNIVKKATPTAAPQAGAPLKLSDIKGFNVVKKAEKPSPMGMGSNPTMKEAIPSFITGAAKDLYSRGKNVLAESQNFADKSATESTGAAVKDLGLSSLHIAGEFARGTGDIIAEAGKSIFNHILSPNAQKSLKDTYGTYEKAINYTATKINDIPGATDRLSKVNEFVDNHPQAVKSADDLSQIVLLALSDLPDTDIQKGLSAAKKATMVAKDVVENEVIPAANKAADAAISAPAAAKDYLKEKLVNSTADTYRETAGLTQKATKTLNKSLARGKDPAQFLAERNITPDIENGRMLTNEAQSKIDTSVEPLNQHLDMALKEVEQSVPKSNLNDLRTSALKDADKLKNITEVTRKQIKAHINEEFDAQIEANGGDPNVGITKVQDIKKAAWGATKFDSTKPYLTDSNYIVGKTAKTTIEDTVPDDAFGVKELNNYIGDHYDAKKFLQSLEGKVVKGGRLGKYAMKGLGTIIGSAFGIPGEVVGFLGGGAVTDILQGTTFTNPLKDLILKNLKVADPEAYQQVLQYIDKSAADRATRLKLPAPTPGKLPNSIEMPAPGILEGQAKLRDPGTPRDPFEGLKVNIGGKKGAKIKPKVTTPSALDAIKVNQNE